MSIQIGAVDRNDRNVDVNIKVEHPDYCPICHNNVAPKFVYSFLSGRGDSSRFLERVYRCPNFECGRIFYTHYVNTPGFAEPDYYGFEKLLPGNPISPSIPDNIVELSPRFCTIYKQASFSESYGLSEICGMGYRKALEFLVKDFLISRSEGLGVTKEDIIQTFLGNCIKKWVEDPPTKSAAELTAWLGNDEAHYYRKWEDKDLTDLKRLLGLTINAINSQLLLEGYENDMKGDDHGF